MKLRRNNHADTGIGTMIIFIAMILVATMAASMIIDVANKVREQTILTAEENIKTISTGFQTVLITAYSEDIDTIDSISICVRTLPNSEPISMNGLVVGLIAENKSYILSYSTVKSDSTHFTVKVIKDMSGSMIEANAISNGDIIQIDIGGIGGSSLNIYPAHKILINLIPSFGTPCNIKLYAPDDLTEKYIQLR